MVNTIIRIKIIKYKKCDINSSSPLPTCRPERPKWLHIGLDKIKLVTKNPTANNLLYWYKNKDVQNGKCKSFFTRLHVKSRKFWESNTRTLTHTNLSILNFKEGIINSWEETFIIQFEGWSNVTSFLMSHTYENNLLSRSDIFSILRKGIKSRASQNEEFQKGFDWSILLLPKLNTKC